MEAETIDNIIKMFNGSDSKHMEFEAQLRPPCPNNSLREATKIDYNHVIQWLLISGFKMVNVKGEDMLRIISSVGEENTRIEMNGIDAIQYYCRHSKIIQPNIHTKKKIKYFSISDYSARLTLSAETPVHESEYASILQNVPLGKKTFRFMNRVRLESPDYPFVYDCSIVKTSNNIEDLFQTEPKYEIEVEFKRHKDLRQHITKAITFALRGYQRSYFPISNTIMKHVVDEYKKVTTTSEFIGPSLVTLQHENLGLIQKDYMVSEKADGERKMLFIVDKRIYLITSAMQVEFTGIVLDDKINYDHTLIDGEHVVKKQNNESMNTYFAFDIYFCLSPNKKIESVRHLPFSDETKCRYDLLQQCISSFNKKDALFKMAWKEFIDFTPATYKTIYDKKYDYHIDGLIFVPKQYGVGMSETQTTVINRQFTWDLNFKWKPPEENTVDFQVKVSDSVHYKSSLLGDIPYKILKLHVGFSRYDIKNNGKYANHQYCMFNRYEIDDFPSENKKVLFKPEAIPHMAIVKDPLQTELGEIIEDDMIIECRYDPTSTEDVHARWVPMRVRWDKMKTKKPNAFTTAISNWYTIKNPITPSMLSDPQQNLYYTTSIRDKSNRALANFHNEIKTHLLQSVIKKGCMLMDFAVGKGGDLFKWKETSFVLGVDLFEDNIKNKANGACERYLDSYVKIKPMRCLFVQGDSTKNIKSGEACNDEYESAIVRSVFGMDPMNKTLGNGVIDHYAKAKHGFNVTSIQFAVHYMFRTITTLTEFLKNVAECTALNGYFVGTCYDGERLFEMLKDKKLLQFTKDGKNVCTITKKYTQIDHADNGNCVGYKISVLQESIGKEIEEYLVFFSYFTKIMDEYGFKLMELKPFETYYGELGSGRDMSPGEQQLSFLNNSFKFQKVKEVSFLPIKLNMVDLTQ